ncbi:FecR domain-containing protein [Methylobacillus arboreus]|uniref:FecR domain-containing protein n=1 Tax=Methylobacillus arboreus TaxID=755170 RepID=UPI001E5FF936|nr:FecR domain-containing protein [Methylobacillus arboreus]MCB5191004.1 FecR domain-containing protein [Methylobacillus arboreus]
MRVFAKPGHAVLQAAAEWYVQLQAENPTVQQLQGFEDWLHADASHRRAWARVQKLEQQFGLLPVDVALPALRDARAKRRAVLKVMALLALTSPAGWLAYEQLPWRAMAAEYTTATGERRQVTLADGGSLFLNTSTALDVDYNERQRLLRLHDGEVLIETAPDAVQRPFLVQTRHGLVQALGTKFSVRVASDETQVSVLQHAVEITPTKGQSTVRLQAGEQASFNAEQTGSIQTLSPYHDAWMRGMLMAVDQPLGEFITELARYRPGILRCDPAIAHLRVSGAFRLADTDEALKNLVATLPIQLVYRTRYWATLTPLS